MNKTPINTKESDFLDRTIAPTALGMTNPEILFSVPRIGIGVLVLRDNKILMLKRKGSHGEGEWNLPGGHLEFGETIENCVKREVQEETGLNVTKVTLICANEELNFIPTNGRHYITLGCVATTNAGDSMIREPEKCEAMEWFEVNHLPSPLFQPSHHIIECYKQGKVTLS